MKTARKYLVVPLVIAAAGAIASESPYHAEDAIVGTATFSVSGSCTVAPQSHAGALFGVVFDNANDYVGMGIVTHDGKLLALVAENGPRTVATHYRDGNGELATGGFVNIADETLYGKMEQNGCPAVTLVPLAQSRYWFRIDSSGESLTVNAGFTGFPDFNQSCRVTDDGTVCRARPFTGRLTFEGSR